MPRYALALLASAPLLAGIFLYALSFRGQHVLGHWPEMWIDDPKGLIASDSLAAGLYYLSLVAIVASLLGPIIVAVMFGLRDSRLLPRTAGRRRAWGAAWVLLYLSGVFVLMGGDRLLWFFD